jgi:hypothetical protein
LIGPARIRKVASETGFRSEVVEKVLYLEAILARLGRHPSLAGSWVLKGGTALNLFWMDVPRLSVDIDLNYVGQVKMEDMQAGREDFESALGASCEAEGCSVRRVPREHAGGKFHLRYAGGIGGAGSLEVDVNYLQRCPLLGIAPRSPRFPPDGVPDPIPVLTFEETAAGKFAALVTRRAARDAFDAWSILEMRPDLLRDRDFRLAFVILAAEHRQDIRLIKAEDVVVSEKAVRDSLFPMLRVERRPFDGDPSVLTDRINDASREAARQLLAWSAGESRFLDGLLDRGEIVPEALSDNGDRQSIIASQAALQWKALNVSKHKGLEKA